MILLFKELILFFQLQIFSQLPHILVLLYIFLWVLPLSPQQFSQQVLQLFSNYRLAFLLFSQLKLLNQLSLQQLLLQIFLKLHLLQLVCQYIREFLLFSPRVLLFQYLHKLQLLCKLVHQLFLLVFFQLALLFPQ